MICHIRNLFHLNNKGVESYENNPDRMSAGLLQHLLFGSADRRQWQVGEIKAAAVKIR
jgi:hypothetical protein